MAGTGRSEIVHAERVDIGLLHTWVGLGIKDPDGLESGMITSTSSMVDIDSAVELQAGLLLSSGGDVVRER